MSSDKAALREQVGSSLNRIIDELNAALTGKNIGELEPVIQRLGGGTLPHWYAQLKSQGTLPNPDGKTVGSILEMLLVAVLEHGVFASAGVTLKVNPARGVDLPDLDLGVKSPSENFCTSEPFFSAYERLYGNDYDCVVFLTDYQSAKAQRPLKLTVLRGKYMRASEIADEKLCACAKKHRDWLMDDQLGGAGAVKRLFRFLAYVNQSDWQAKQLLRLANAMGSGDDALDKLVDDAKKDFTKQNRKREKEGRELLPPEDLAAITAVKLAEPRWLSVLSQLDNWVAQTLMEAARSPNENEWKQLLASPLDGKIGMSFALQWRYNFGRVFGEPPPPAAQEQGIPAEDMFASPVDVPDQD